MAYCSQYAIQAIQGVRVITEVQYRGVPPRPPTASSPGRRSHHARWRPHSSSVPGDQAASGDPTWRKRRDNMWHFYNANPAKPHYVALKQILNAYADNLTAAIDRQPR